LPEDEKANDCFFSAKQMYLLLEGEVGVLVKGKPVSTVRNGEIFGEMAFNHQYAEDATATAKTVCSLIALVINSSRLLA